MSGAEFPGRAAAGGVDDLLITPELARRPSRPPDHAAENRALGALAQEMAASPGTVLQRLTDLVVEAGWAQSAGVSILEPHDASAFRWRAVSGLWAAHVGGSMPFDESPCGVVVARDAPLLFARPHERFPAADVEPLIREILLVPFHAAGRPVGTLWAVAHDEGRRFDAEDLRVLTSLARSAAAAHQLTGALAEAERGRGELERRVEERTEELVRANDRLRGSEARLAADLAGMRRLYDLHAKLAAEADLRAALGRILAVAVGFMGTDRGTVQLVSDDGERLEMFATHGHGAGSGFIHHFMHEGSKPACDAARRQRKRLVIEDVAAFPALAGTRDREVALAEGIRATCCTPLVGRKGETIGVLCAQFRRPHRPTDHELRLTDLLAWTAADFVERHRAEAALRGSEERHRAELERQVRERTAELERSRDLLRATMDSSMDMIQVFEAVRDESGGIVDFRWVLNNHTSESRYGEVRGESLLQRNPGVVEEGIFDDFKRVAETGEPRQVERRYAHEQFDGWFLQSVVKLGDGVATTTKEITGWKEAQEQVLRLRDEVAQAKLRESEERFRTLAEAVEDVFYITDLDRGALLYLSPAYERVWGRPAAELMADVSRFPESLHPDDLPARREAQAARLRGGPAAIEYRILRPDGEVRWILDRSFPVRAGERRLTAGVASDVTARKEAEAALRASEELFRQFGEASSDVLWVRDAETLRWEYLSPAFEAVYGLARGEALAGDTMRNWADLILPEDRGRALAAIGRVGTGERATFEYRIQRPSDGRVRWLRNTDFPMRDGAGRVVRIGGIGQDVTALKEAEAAVAESEARLRTLVEGVPELVWRASEAGLWTWSSPQWGAFTGQSQEGSRGLGWLGAVHPDDRGAAARAWEEAGPRGLLDVEYRIRRASDGAWLWHHTRAAPVRGAGGRVLEWLGTSADVEERVRAREVLARGREELEALVAARTAELAAAEETLRQAQKMEAVGQLTGGIAHDFNNMLQGVSGAVEMARRRVEAGRPDEAGRYLDAAREATGRAAGLTRRLLAFARRQRLDPKPVDPDGLVAGMADLVRRAVGPGVRVELKLRGGAGSVLCDPNELESALLNLCINARDAMPDGGRLVVGTEDARLSAADVAGQDGPPPGAYTAVSVSDTGQGMPPEVLRRVFEPFFTTKPVGQGTGLGLSQVYGFARQSGGLVRIESAPGRGTTVRLLLPTHARAEAATAAAEREAPAVLEGAGAGAAVLLVDDEDAVRRPAAERLRELGFRVLEAGDGPSALRLLAEGARIDLLVTDVGLPGGMNGRQVAEAARERAPGLPVLFITGYAGAALPPGVEVVGKPFELDALARRVQAILEAGRRSPDRKPGA